jgi:hypothetical protein
MATTEQIIRANSWRREIEQELADFERYYEDNIEEMLASVVAEVAAEQAAEQQQGPGIVQAMLAIAEEYADEQRGE